MADKIIRVLAKDAPVKASAITAKEMVERARQIHKTLPVATAALGRSLMAASMMGNQLKEKDGSVTLRIKGGGPLGGITMCLSVILVKIISFVDAFILYTPTERLTFRIRNIQYIWV